MGVGEAGHVDVYKVIFGTLNNVGPERLGLKLRVANLDLALRLISKVNDFTTLLLELTVLRFHILLELFRIKRAGSVRHRR